jgi:hypothetical protein
MKSTWVIDGKTPETGSQSFDVSSNADKLALTGLSPGDIVVITGEADRVEVYLGGGESSDANWLVLHNTVRLVVYAEFGDITIDGVMCYDEVTTVLGWYPVDSLIPVVRWTFNYHEGDKHISDGTTVFLDWACWENPLHGEFIKSVINGGVAEYFHIPTFVAPRATLTLLIEDT